MTGSNLERESYEQFLNRSVGSLFFKKKIFFRVAYLKKIFSLRSTRNLSLSQKLEWAGLGGRYGRWSSAKLSSPIFLKKKIASGH